MDPMTVTPDNYAQHAERTERITTENETLPAETAFVLALSMKAAFNIGDQLDRLKRSIFYGQNQDMKDILAKLPDCKLEHPVITTELTPQQKRLLHAALGLMTEAIEFAESVSRHIFDGKPFDEVHAKEEIGDIFWYSAIPVNLFKWTYGDIMFTNVAKLRARYPDKWNQEAALNRDLEEERRILEQGSKPSGAS